MLEFRDVAADLGRSILAVVGEYFFSVESINSDQIRALVAAILIMEIVLIFLIARMVGGPILSLIIVLLHGW
jgi:predicted RND superfamily exporter protein